jgi:hypothetical protein
VRLESVDLGHSLLHAQSVCLVLNLQTDWVSPQFHVVMDPTFSTAVSGKDGNNPRIPFGKSNAASRGVMAVQCLHQGSSTLRTLFSLTHPMHQEPTLMMNPMVQQLTLMTASMIGHRYNQFLLHWMPSEMVLQELVQRETTLSSACLFSCWSGWFNDRLQYT